MKTNLKEIIEEIERERRARNDEKAKELEEKYLSEIKKFENKKIKITYQTRVDFLTKNSEEEGKIITTERGVFFVKKRGRTKGYRITGGLYEGFFGYIVVFEIEEIEK